MRWLALVVVLAVTKIAVAEPDATAGEMFQQGRDLAKQGRYAEACALFARSYGLEPALGTAVNLADCLERRGELRRAWELFDLVARNSVNVQSRARLARERADALLPRLATLIITLGDPTAAGLVLRIGERDITPAAQLQELLEPGDVELTASVPGKPAFTRVLHAAAGATMTVAIPAFAALEAPVTGTRRQRSRMVLAGGLAGVGVIGLGVALGFAVSAKLTYDDAFRHGCNHAPTGTQCMTGPDGTSPGARMIHLAGTRADIATTSAIAGAAVAAAGLAVFLTAPSETVRVAPLASDRALGLGIVGRF